MNIAVIIYGHMRSFEKCYPSLIKFILEPFNPDIFIHTWSLNESSTPSWHHSHCNKIHPIDSDRIKSLYNPISLLIEEQPTLPSDFNKVVDGVNFFGFNCMYQSLSKANSLKLAHEIKNGSSYDIVVKIRPDVLLKKAIPFNFSSDIAANKIHIAGNKKNNMDMSIHGYAAVDIINIACSNTMNTISDLSYYVYDFFNPSNAKENGFSNFILKQKLTPVMLDYKYHQEWEIIRA